ncbi:MAG: hemolysin III family protein [Gammaproteobacteria bacterium]|nr:hemolysin III family protein [Gammaproteobacteria bacterium]
MTVAPYTYREEIANYVSHGVGALLSIVGFVVLLIHAISEGSIAKLISYSVYGVSLFALFVASTLYHAIRKAELKRVFKILDHCAIYLLIAGTYTPLLAITLKGTLGYTMLAVIWVLAAIGIVFKIKFSGRFKIVSLVSYLSMGFICLFFINSLYQSLSTTGFVLLVTGGLTYALGVYFYVQKKIAFNHAIWHLFVLAGAMSHYFMILVDA